MIKEMTESNVGEGMLFYDGACGVCSTGARQWSKRLRSTGVRFVPLQDPQASMLTGLSATELRSEVKLLTPEGRVLGGVDVLLYVAQRLWWARLPALVASMSVVKPLLSSVYALFARNRYRISRTCELDGTCALSAPE